VHASNWYFERLCQLCPIHASLDVCVRVVWIGIISVMPLNQVICADIPTATDFPSSRSSLATLRHLSLCILVNSKSGQSARRYTTYTLEYVLVNTLVAERLQMLLEPRRLSCAGTSTKDHQLEIVLSDKDYRACEMSTSIRNSRLSRNLLASVLLIETGETCALGSNVRMNGRGPSPRKNSSGVMNLMPTLLARSLLRCQ
jgi:hypothetical protein